jgi:tripartite-type tricarboxylate transporter receptor subunit TctC
MNLSLTYVSAALPAAAARRRLAGWLLAYLTMAPGVMPVALAQSPAWPSRPIRIIVPHPPGGPSDTLLRSVSDKMFATLKQPLVIENKPGAGGNIGAVETARAAPDGYTWMLGTDTVLTINPHLYKKPGFRLEDLAPVSIATHFSQILVCNPSVGVTTLAELATKARATPMTYASGGAGVPGHMAMELLLATAKFDMTHVPYKGPAPAMQDVIAGVVPCGFLAGPTVLPQINAGKLVALAVSGARRLPLAPSVPTVAQAGYPDFDATFSLLLSAPRGVPEPVIKAFHAAFVEALAAPDVQARLRAGDQEPVGDAPAQATAQVIATSKKWGEVARRINLQLD